MFRLPYLFALLLNFCFGVSFCLAQDSLRIIELSLPGESAPVDIPAGHAFTFSLFSPASGSSDWNSVAGVVSFPAPYLFRYESKITEDYWGYEGWYLGPAKVSLKASGQGGRMQLYTRKLPQGIISGILTSNNPARSVEIPKGSLLTSFFGFSQIFLQSEDNNASPFTHELSIKSQNGVIFGLSRLPTTYVTWRLGNPRMRGVAQLHNLNAESSAVVNSFYFDDLDAVSPTADFCGPGNATFSLPTKRTTDIAFYCYRITPANVIGADASPPLVQITVPATTSISTTAATYALKGSVTDNINPTKINFRLKPPNTSTYGNWEILTLSGGAQTKNWERSVNLRTKGSWLIQIQPFDAEGNGGVVQTITITKN